MADMEEPQVPQGIVLVDKPEGWTSFDVVAKVRGTIARQLGLKNKRVKVGHSGTLDPAATGLLILAIGKATKRITTLTKLDKTYDVEVTFGQTSTTGDKEGELLATGASSAAKGDVLKVLQEFVGEQQQTPPIYSAIKIDGQRAYKLAREGKEVVLKQRMITIHNIDAISYEWPKLSFSVRVSSGTYIRSLVTDIGDSLGVGAYMSELRRTSIGEFSLTDAIKINKTTTCEDILKVLQ